MNNADKTAGITARQATVTARLALGCVACGAQAVTLTAVVQGGKSGVVGETGYVTSVVTGYLFSGNQFPFKGFPALMPADSNCLTISNNSNIAKGSSGTYGFLLSGPTPGAVLLVDGIGSWERKIVNGPVVSGTVAFTRGTWRNSWSSEVPGQVSTASTREGTASQGEAFVGCPNVHGIIYAVNLWDKFYDNNFSLLNVKFVIDAPVGGMAPGKYSLPAALYHYNSYSAPQLLLDGVNIQVPNYGCTLTAPTTVSLDNGANATSTITLVARCDAGTTAPVMAWLSATASGSSAGVATTPQQLCVANSSGNIFIRGSWSAAAPTCSASYMYFDGRNGYPLGGWNPGQPVDFGSVPISFRLCTTDDAAPGAYTAQATFSIVQR